MQTCKSRTQISSKLAWLSMRWMYSHAFICHLLLICRIPYSNLVLFISHKAVTFNLVILKILHPSSKLCFSVIIQYTVRLQLRKFEENGTSSVVLLYIILSNLSAGFFPLAWLQCTVGYSTKVKSGISTLITFYSSLILQCHLLGFDLIILLWTLLNRPLVPQSKCVSKASNNGCNVTVVWQIILQMLSSVDNNGSDGSMLSTEASQGLDKPREMAVVWLGKLLLGTFEPKTYHAC